MQSMKEICFFFGQDIFRAFDLFPHIAWVLAGDYNSVLIPQHVQNGVGFHQKYCSSLADLVKVRNLVDIFRSVYPTVLEFTFNRLMLLLLGWTGST